MSMLKTQYKPLNRTQFKLLREAKALIKNEFSEELSLQAETVLDKIYEYALQSNGEELYEIFTELGRDTEVVTQEPESVKTTPVRVQLNINAIHKIKVGDIVEGARCTSMYRGKPIFEAI